MLMFQSVSFHPRRKKSSQALKSRKKTVNDASADVEYKLHTTIIQASPDDCKSMNVTMSVSFWSPFFIIN